MNDSGDAATLAGVTAAALDRGRAIDAWSLALTLAAVGGGALWTADGRTAWSAGCFAACVVGGIAQRYYAARVAFDAALFRSWARRIDVPPGIDFHAEALAATDRALAELRLRNNEGPTRDLTARSRGALRLLGRQMLCLFLQFAALLAAFAR